MNQSLTSQTIFGTPFFSYDIFMSKVVSLDVGMLLAPCILLTIAVLIIWYPSATVQWSKWLAKSRREATPNGATREEEGVSYYRYLVQMGMVEVML